VLGSHVEVIRGAGDLRQLLPRSELARNILIVVENQNTMRHARILASRQRYPLDRPALTEQHRTHSVDLTELT
jgi:hypothetical protein